MLAEVLALFAAFGKMDQRGVIVGEAALLVLTADCATSGVLGASVGEPATVALIPGEPMIFGKMLTKVAVVALTAGLGTIGVCGDSVGLPAVLALAAACTVAAQRGVIVTFAAKLWLSAVCTSSAL